jgi:Protein of unknown function (DUF1254)
VKFVQAVTDAAGTQHVPPAARIAVFDNDGTLWSEQPRSWPRSPGRPVRRPPSRSRTLPRVCDDGGTLAGTAVPLTAARAQMNVTPTEARAIAKEAYIYGFPVVDNYRIQYSYFVDLQNPEFKAPWNQIRNIPRVYTPADTVIQTPNSDTPYSFVGMDLRAEPLVLTVPPIEKGALLQCSADRRLHHALCAGPTAARQRILVADDV